MPNNRIIQKAGKLSFLLVCLFLCTACQGEKAVFEAGAAPVAVKQQTEQQKEIAEQEVSKPEKLSENSLVNINTADMTELMTLPGIGKTRAKAILDYRTMTGEFQKIEDIMNVKGIKTGIFSKISSLITVD